MKVAVFPGSFDPVTLAHQDIVLRALELFDRIIVAVGTNSTKQGLLSTDDRVAILQEVFAEVSDRVEVTTYKGLTVDYCRHAGANYILRGLRNTNDFEFEYAIAQNNKHLAPEIDTIFLMSTSGLGHISSTIVRDVTLHKGDISSMVPAAVISYMERKSR
ncbi:pantetheine-phosphate adenylyltransferase [Sphingobacterium spiritivorum]|uniref:pantetheine-phosphate adenylyltransferase n=1 Tax=Sphingobacterium spiritivorum TaxID=258 RepID=UPI003DA4AC5A